MKKKLVSLMVLMTVSLGLVGCTQKTQEKFIKRIGEVTNQKNNEVALEMSLPNMEVSEDTKNPIINMMVTQIKDAKIKVDVLRDSKDKTLTETSITMDLMGMSIPVSVIGSAKEDEPKFYLSMDSLSSIKDIMQSITGEASIDNQEEIDALKGKYVDISDLQEDEEETNALKDLGKELSTSEKYNQAYAKELQNYINSLDAKTFEEKDDTITHTFTFKEIQGLIKMRDKVIKSDDSFKDIDVPSSEELIKSMEKEFKDISVELIVYTKDNKIEYNVKMVPTDEKNENGIKNMTLKGVLTSKSSDKRVELPSKDKIVSSEELEKLNAAQQTQEISDEEFATFLETLKTAQENGSIDSDTQTEILEGYKDILSDEQYKQVEDIFK